MWPSPTEADLRTALLGHYRIEIIDLLENPQLARGDQILAVPTLVRRLPEPIRRSSATSRTRNACWSGWISVSASDQLMPLNRRHLRALFEPAGQSPLGERYTLRLYVTGMTSRRHGP